jgi:gamma-glutamyl-gamma-aminobutyrate hydrolase PuuD
VEPDREAGDGTGFLLAVQWHPEAGDDPRLFEALIGAALAVRGLALPG